MWIMHACQWHQEGTREMKVLSSQPAMIRLKGLPMGRGITVDAPIRPIMAH